MTGTMKEMFDRSYYPLLGRVEGRPYATAIAAGSDGRGAQAQIDRIVTGWLAPAGRGAADRQPRGPDRRRQILAEKHVADDALERCRDLGAALAEGLRMGIF